MPGGVENGQPREGAERASQPPGVWSGVALATRGAHTAVSRAGRRSAAARPPHAADAGTCRRSRRGLLAPGTTVGVCCGPGVTPNRGPAGSGRSRCGAGPHPRAAQADGRTATAPRRGRRRDFLQQGEGYVLLRGSEGASPSHPTPESVPTAPAAHSGDKNMRTDTPRRPGTRSRP